MKAFVEWKTLIEQRPAENMEMSICMGCADACVQYVAH